MISLLDVSEEQAKRLLKKRTKKRTKSSKPQKNQEHVSLLKRSQIAGKETAISLPKNTMIALRQLLTVGNVLDVFLPWKQPSNRSILEGRIQHYQQDPKQTAEISLKALLSFTPEIVILHASERLSRSKI